MGSEAPTPQSRPVVAGVDGSRSASSTVDLAAAEAARIGAPLRIVHVWPGRYRGTFRSRGLAPTLADGRRLLEVMARRAELTGPDLPISTELLEGGAANVLNGCSSEARLLVIGHRDDPLTRPSWGTTAAYLAHHSECPLLVNRGAAHEGPVVVASSASEAGAATLGYAFVEAAARGTRLVAVHMWTRPGALDGSAPVVVKGGYAVERREADDRLREALTVWSDRFPHVDVELLVVSDLDIGCTVERASRRGQLLVAGIGQHGRFAELLYGSAGAALAGMRAATCPVVLVPAGWPVVDPVLARR